MTKREYYNLCLRQSPKWLAQSTHIRLVRLALRTKDRLAAYRAADEAELEHQDKKRAEYARAIIEGGV